jgi:drug/metabolite transporter (DMT)-like permease
VNGGYTTEQAAALNQFQRQLRRHRRRRLIAVGTAVLGVVVLVQHWVNHLGVAVPIGLSPRWQDVLIGYPMGAALLLAGLVLRGRRL